MAIRQCKYGAGDAFTEEIEDADLDLNGHTVPGTATFYMVAGKAPDPANPGQYLGGTSGSTVATLVTGYITVAATTVTTF